MPNPYTAKNFYRHKESDRLYKRICNATLHINGQHLQVVCYSQHDDLSSVHCRPVTEFNAKFEPLGNAETIPV